MENGDWNGLIRQPQEKQDDEDTNQPSPSIDSR